MTTIREALGEFNPWWKERFEVEFKEREIYKTIRKYMSLSQVIALTGLRRVGKTTLMLKIVEDAINKLFSPRNIVYFSFDEFKDIEIRDVIKEYESILGKELGKDKYLFLLDEIQKLNNWENQLKSIYDVFGKRTKIVISGSESLFIKKKSKETLAGRIFEFKVEQLSFREFLSFKSFDFKPIGLHERELARMLNEFILTQGFPELVGVADKEIIKKYIVEGIIEKIIYKDIPGLFSVKDISVLESLLNVFLDNPGQLIEISELAKEFKISRQTMSNYLLYLEQSFLIRKLYNFSNNKRTSERKLKKYYPSIVSTNILFKDDDSSKSRVFEWLIVTQLRARFFWRDAYKNEVDIVLLDNQKLMPIEVKYGRLDFGGLTTFMKKFNVDHGYVISASKEEKHTVNKKDVNVVPAYKFLLRQ